MNGERADFSEMGVCPWLTVLVEEAAPVLTVIGVGAIGGLSWSSISAGALPLLLERNHCMTLFALRVEAGLAPASTRGEKCCGVEGDTWSFLGRAGG